MNWSLGRPWEQAGGNWSLRRPWEASGLGSELERTGASWSEVQGASHLVKLSLPDIFRGVCPSVHGVREVHPVLFLPVSPIQGEGTFRRRRYNLFWSCRRGRGGGYPDQ